MSALFWILADIFTRISFWIIRKYHSTKRKSRIKTKNLYIFLILVLEKLSYFKNSWICWLPPTAIVKEIQSYVEDTTDWLMKIKFDWRCSKHFIPCFSRCKINIYHYSIFQMHNESNPSKRPWKNILNKLLQQK